MVSKNAFVFPTSASMNPQATKAPPQPSGPAVVAADAVEPLAPLTAPVDWEWGTEVGPNDTVRLKVGDRFVAASKTDPAHQLYCRAIERRGTRMACQVRNGGWVAIFDKSGDEIPPAGHQSSMRIRLLLPKQMFRVPNMDKYDLLLNVVYRQLRNLDVIRGKAPQVPPLSKVQSAAPAATEPTILEAMAELNPGPADSTPADTENPVEDEAVPVPVPTPELQASSE